MRDFLKMYVSAVLHRGTSCFHSVYGLLLVISVVFTTLILPAPPTHAAQTVPYKVNFQGRLTDNAGNVVANGTYNLKFRIYTASTGGTASWTETWDSSTSRVQVTNGLFSVQLGTYSALSPSLFTTQPLYLEVELPTPATATGTTPSWTEGAMTPRQAFGSAPYTMNADTVDGIDGASLAQLSANNTFTGSNLFKPSSDSTTAFQVQKSDSTPLLVADTSNLALKVGGGDVSPDANPALLVLDYKSTSGDPATTTNGAMYYNNSSSKFRCYENGAWKDCITTALNLRNNYFYQNDFTLGAYTTNATTDNSYTLYSFFATATIANSPGEANHPGIARINTTTSSPSIGGFLTQTAPVNFGNGSSWTYLSDVRASALSQSPAAVYEIRSGFLDAITTGSTETGINNGCYIRYTLTDTAYVGVCRTGGVNATCSTIGIAPSINGWDALSVTVNSAGTAATFSVTSSSGSTGSCTVSSGLPTATTGFGMSAYKVSGSTARTIDVDYMDVRANLSR